MALRLAIARPLIAACDPSPRALQCRMDLPSRSARRHPRPGSPLVAPDAPRRARARRRLRQRAPPALAGRPRLRRHRRRPRRAARSSRCAPSAEIVVADIEGAPWPFAGRALRRGDRHQLPLAAAVAALLGALADGGVLLYETFARGQREASAARRGPSSCSSQASCCASPSGCTSSPTRTAGCDPPPRGCSASPRCRAGASTAPPAPSVPASARKIPRLRKELP